MPISKKHLFMAFIKSMTSQNHKYLNQLFFQRHARWPTDFNFSFFLSLSDVIIDWNGLFPHVNTAYTIFSTKAAIHVSNHTVFDGLFPHVNTAYTIFRIKLLYNLTTLLPWYTMDVTMEDIPLFPHVNTVYIWYKAAI